MAPENRDLVLMAVFAHPDDESFGMGGTLSKYAAEGYTVQVVTATRGEAGQILDPTLSTPANLPYLRERELHCACEAYGIPPAIFLDYIDGQLTIVNQGQAVGKLVRLIRQFRPQVMVTFGPDGIYGHYDHIAVHRWATIAFDLAADHACFPDQIEGACQPHQVSKLYHLVLSDEVAASISPGNERPGVLMDGVPFPFVSHPQEEITTVIDIGDYVERKLKGILCHRSQIDPNDSYLQSAQEVTNQAMFRQEGFILARTTLPRAPQREPDLFQGLR